MNLHGVVSGMIGAVNPHQPAVLYRSLNYQTLESGRQVPKYNRPERMTAQVQDLSQKDIAHLDALNVQGSQRVVYLSGEVAAIVRVAQKGGDLLSLADGNVWLTTAVLEQWPDWCKVAVTMQTDLEPPVFAAMKFNDKFNSQYVPLAF